NARGSARIEQAGFARINHIQCDADGDGLAVGNVKVRQLLQLVRRPVAEVERAGGAGFKRITAGRNMVQVQFGATADEPFHRLRLEGGKLPGVALQFFKKYRVADAGDFHRLDEAGAFVARGERREQVEIVDDGKRWRKGAD